MPKDIPSNEIINYRLDNIENRISSLENKIVKVMSDNHGSANNINMEILNLLMSYIKSDHKNHNVQPLNNDSTINDSTNDVIHNTKDLHTTKTESHKMQINAFNRMGTL